MTTTEAEQPSRKQIPPVLYLPIRPGPTGGVSEPSGATVLVDVLHKLPPAMTGAALSPTWSRTWPAAHGRRRA